MKYPTRRGSRREVRELLKRDILLGPRKSGSDWIRYFSLIFGGVSTASGLVLGIRALLTHQPVEAAVNAVLLFLFGMIITYAGNHDHFVTRQLSNGKQQ